LRTKTILNAAAGMIISFLAYRSWFIDHSNWIEKMLAMNY